MSMQVRDCLSGPLSSEFDGVMVAVAGRPAAGVRHRSKPQTHRQCIATRRGVAGDVLPGVLFPASP